MPDMTDDIHNEHRSPSLEMRPTTQNQQSQENQSLVAGDAFPAAEFGGARGRDPESKSHHGQKKKISWRKWWQLLPKCGLLALLITFLCMLLCCLTLWSSDGITVETWPTEELHIQPAVLLAILAGISNAAVAYAFNEGTIIVWWVKAHNDPPAKDLDNYWESSNSVWKSLKSFTKWKRSFVDRRIPIAVLLITLVIVDGPLLQRASKTSSLITSHEPNPMTVSYNSGLFLGSTGMSTGTSDPKLLTPEFRMASVVHDMHYALRMNHTECKGTCAMEIIGPGFDILCTKGKRSFNLTDNPLKSHLVGSVNVIFNISDPGLLRLESVFKDKSACSGTLATSSCRLRLATTKHLITVTNGIVKYDIVLQSLKGIDSFKSSQPNFFGSSNDTLRIQHLDAESGRPGSWNSTLGGLALISQTLFQSRMYFNTTMTPFTVDLQGATALTPVAKGTPGTCDMRWKDPTQAIVNTMRILLFRMSLSTSKYANDTQIVEAVDVYARVVYISNYGYLIAALAFMLLASLAAGQMFCEWNEVIGKPTLKPSMVAEVLARK